MNTNGVFTIHIHDVLFEKYGKPIYLFPWGDLHRYTEHCAEDKWFEFLDRVKKKKNTYFLGMGDYDDMLSASERNSIKSIDVHESTGKDLEKLFKQRIDNLCKEIDFMKGKLIGLVEGNHFAELSSGITTTQRMCETLDCKYLGASSIIRLRFIKTGEMKGGEARCRNSLDIFVHHGRGASRTCGGSINSVEKMCRIAEADIYLMGHDHQKTVTFINRLKLTPGTPTLDNRKILLGRTGSFLKGYIEDKPSYVVDALYPPTDLGTLKIELTPTRKGIRTYIAIHASI